MQIKDLHIQLIEYIDEYRQKYPDKEPSMHDFLHFALNREEKIVHNPNIRLNIEIPKHLCFLYRYVKLYMRKVIKDSNLQTEDEYTYLISLIHADSMIKSELINLNIMEKTSGTEIIKRLVRKGLIEEWNDELDKRSKRVRITRKGREELMRILPGLNVASAVISANLSEEEKEDFYRTLKSLNEFHMEIFQNQRNCSIEEISENIQKK